MSGRQSRKAAPVQAHERIEFVDILRGFALLGVLAANMYSYAGTSYNPQSYAEPIDRAIVLLTRFFVEAKFYSLFSLLFGWGLSVQMMRAEARGARFVPLYLRRMAILFLFGLIHAFFVWKGDILATYALFGCLLLLFRKRSNGFILAASGLALLLVIVVTLPALDGFRTWYTNATDFLRPGTYSEGLYASGTYWEITRLRFQEYVAGDSWFILWFGNMFSMFLLGLYVGKRRIFHDLDQHLTLIRLVLVGGLIAGVAFTGLYALTLVRPNLVPGGIQWALSRGARTIGAPALMLFYVCTLILLVRREAWHRRLAPLASVGRAALSNYLAQSVIGTLLFYSYGLGLYGQIDPLLVLILTVVILVIQIRLSEWWFT
ncbi:MAG: DUF418 domain-containing protein, partial [Anaerolineae bacterium]